MKLFKVLPLFFLLVTAVMFSVNAQDMPTDSTTGRNPRLNSLGLTVGYSEVSNFGFSVNGTVSPARFTFFDFDLGLGFSDFSFNGNVNFNGFVPFNNGGWYGGVGLGGGLYGAEDSRNGYFAINAGTGFLFFNWLNVSAVLQMEVVPEFNLRFKPMLGYVYRFEPDQNDETDESSTGQREPRERKPPTRDTEQRHFIFVEAGTFTVGLMYEYLVTPKFSLGVRGYYAPIIMKNMWFNAAESNTGFSVTPRWYPYARSFYMELGLGYNNLIWRTKEIRYVYRDSGYGTGTYTREEISYEVKLYESGFSIIPGIGWNLYNSGGFNLNTGIRFGLSLVKNQIYSELNGYYDGLMVGYAPIASIYLSFGF